MKFKKRRITAEQSLSRFFLISLNEDWTTDPFLAAKPKMNEESEKTNDRQSNIIIMLPEQKTKLSHSYFSLTMTFLRKFS